MMANYEMVMSFFITNSLPSCSHSNKIFHLPFSTPSKGTSKTSFPWLSTGKMDQPEIGFVLKKYVGKFGGG